MNIENELYNGGVVLKFVPKQHRYYAKVDGVTKYPSGVTSVLKSLYDQSDLLEWYSSMAAGEIIKSLAPYADWLDTAFMAIYKGEQPEIPAGIINIPLPNTRLIDLYNVGKQAPLNKSKYGKDVGTQTHEAVDRYHKTGEAYIDKTGIEANDTAAQKSLDAYIKWYESSDLEVIASEVMVYSIKHNYAGTLDRIYRRPDGGLIMGDFKTSNLSRKSPTGIRESYWSQLGAYMVAYEEEHGVKFSDAVIVNSPKKGSIKVGYASQMGVTPEELKQLWLDDLKCANNHKKITKNMSNLKHKG